MKSLYKLEEVIDLERFQDIQDNIAEATDLALLMVDFKGVPVTQHSGCTTHCQQIRELGHYRDLCQKCDSRGGLEAARLQKPYIYVCHRGIVDLAVPIIVGDQYLGAMMAGQVLLAEALEDTDLEQIVAKKVPEGMGEAVEMLDQLRDDLPKMTLKKIEAAARMLSNVSSYIVEEAVLKARMTEIAAVEAAKTARSSETPPLAEGAQGEAPLPVAQPDVTSRRMPPERALIQPALDYVEAHLSEELYVEAMAKLCRVSESYFSKCFNKAMGMGFAAYHNQRRLIKAEQLLLQTDLTVNELSDQLGFDSTGYFIKLFKKQFEVTPVVYRRTRTF